MQITKTMLEMFMVTDEQGEVKAGPFFYECEAAEWMEENLKDE